MSKGLRVDLIRNLSQLPYINPFSLERQELEAKLVGSKHHLQASARRSDPRSNESLKEIVELARTELEKWFIQVGESALPKDLFTVYEDTVYLVLYYDLAESMDRFIGKAHEKGQSKAKLLFYNKYQEEFLRYFPEGSDHHYKLTHTPEHLFSIFFQIRRAYYHIFEQFFGQSAAVVELRSGIWQSIFTHDIRRYARALSLRLKDSVTLITGESGTGKELVARAIGLSQYIPFNATTLRFEEDFLAGYYPINLAALSETLIESEVFGHKKGSFTGAQDDHAGYLESCGNYGAVFFDEIGEISESIQVKLLRVLQTRRFQRLGATESLEFKGKVLAATNRDLSEAISTGRFREDFYFRLCSDRIHTPNLKEMLASSESELEHLIAKVSERLVGENESKALADEVLECIRTQLDSSYPWPGNFRELEQCVRNILLRGKYEPLPMEGQRDGLDEGSFLKTNPSAHEVLTYYASKLYGEFKSIEDVAETLKLDRRTARKYISQLVGVDAREKNANERKV